MTKKLQSREEFFIQFSDEEVEELKMEKGQKFTVEMLDDGAIKLVPFSTIDIDLSEFPRETLEFLLQQSCDKDVSINEVISDLLGSFIECNE